MLYVKVCFCYNNTIGILYRNYTQKGCGHVQDVSQREIKIPENYSAQKKFANLVKTRNLIEAAIWFVIVGGYIYKTPLLFKVRIILIVSIGGSIAIFNLIGIKNMSISQFIIAYIKFLRGKKNYHLRSVANVECTKITQITKYTKENESVAELLIRKFKERRRRYTGGEQKETLIKPPAKKKFLEIIKRKIGREE